MRGGDRCAQVEAGRLGFRRLHRGAQCHGGTAHRPPIRQDQPELVAGPRAGQQPQRRLAKFLEDGCATANRAGTQRVVDDEDQRGRGMPTRATTRPTGPRSRQHQGGDQGHPDQQQQPVLEPEPPLVATGGVLEVPDRGEGLERRLATGHQVEDQRDRHRGERGEHPGGGEGDHAR
jgi:hypothetical protein